MLTLNRKYYKKIRKLKLRFYRKGWEDCEKEKELIVERYKNDKKKSIETSTKEFEETRDDYNKRLQKMQESITKEKNELTEASQKEKQELIKKHSDELIKKNDEHKILLEATMLDAQNRIDEIKEIAKQEIIKANERETEYQALISKLKLLFHEGSAKFLVTAGEQESLMNDMAKMIHRKNEFLKLTGKFDKLLTEHKPDITNVNVNKLSEKGKTPSSASKQKA